MKDLLPPLSPGALISQIITGCLAYYLLLSDNCLHCSISTIIEYGHTLPVNKHLMLLGILPIYIAVVIFGVAILSAAFGKWLQTRWLGLNIRQKRSKVAS